MLTWSSAWKSWSLHSGHPPSPVTAQFAFATNPGKQLEVNRGLRFGEALLDYDPAVISRDRIAGAIANEGYQPVVTW